MSTTIFRLHEGNPGGNILSWLASLARALPEHDSIPAISRKKVLIVDDDQVILKGVSLKLQSAGYAVVTATDASMAIAAMRDEQPDLVILDLNFPPDVASGGFVAWDGFQIMSWLRGLGAGGNVPFIIITSDDPASCEHKSLTSGAVAFFHKPIDYKALLPVIKQALASRADPVKPTSSGEA